MSSLESRIGRLHVVYGRRPGCNRCRTWGGTVAIINGGEASRPECCPDCGRRVPVNLVRHYLIRQIPMEHLPAGEDPADPSFV